MVVPDYSGGSIANLMASVAAAHGAEDSQLPPLRDLAPEEISRYRTTILLVVDALGHEFLLRHGNGPFARHLRTRITSVFPSTTAAAIPTFLTGLPPAAHGLTGWFMYLRELGAVLAVLPGYPRYGGVPYGKAGIAVTALFGNVPFFDRLQSDCHMVAPQSIAHSDFNRAHLGRARLHSYTTLPDMFARMAGIARAATQRCYVYAYWPRLDHIGHEKGIGSRAARHELGELEAGFGGFLEEIAGTDTLVLVTADHGMLDASEFMELDACPGLEQELALPLSGEPRAAYCYVRAGRERKFEMLVAETLGDRVDLHRSSELLRNGWFGPPPHNARIAARIGDYTMLPRGERVVADRVLGEQLPRLKGVHGGLSAAEMYVPLIVAGGAGQGN